MLHKCLLTILLNIQHLNDFRYSCGQDVGVSKFELQTVLQQQQKKKLESSKPNTWLEILFIICPIPCTGYYSETQDEILSMPSLVIILSINRTCLQ